MTQQQILLFGLFGIILALLLWGKFRHDLVAAGGLFAAVLLGLVPESKAFSGFSEEAVVIVALVLIASRALENSGALGLLTGGLSKPQRSLSLHIVIIGGVGALLSTVMNNVAALAMLMPIDIQTARKAGRPPGKTLMPLAFATILGGLVTLIGTPPNIIVSGIRAERLGSPYRMFDFAPVGLVVAAAGLLFVALFGWRLLSPKRQPEVLDDEEAFMAELTVPAESYPVGKYLFELEDAAKKADVVILGLIHQGKRLRQRAYVAPIVEDDSLVVEGATDGIAEFIKAVGLHAGNIAGKKKPPAEGETALEAFTTKEEGGHVIMEGVVRADARIAGRSAAAFQLRSRFGVTLLGISHHGRTFRENLSQRRLETGDLLLLSGSRASLGHVAHWLGIMPVDEISVAAPSAWRIAVAVGAFAAAIAAASAGVLSFAVAIAIAAAVYGVTGLVSAREFYDQIEWPIIVMLACLLPLGHAFEQVGATDLVAGFLLRFTQGQSPVLTLVLLMVVTMLLSDVLNNVATIIIAAPLAIVIAQQLGVNPDTFLMGVTVATSCAFLTPIGHKNNTLILGPGGYSFRDYWRMGLPLELVVLAVTVPMLLWIWPL